MTKLGTAAGVALAALAGLGACGSQQEGGKPADEAAATSGTQAPDEASKAAVEQVEQSVLAAFQAKNADQILTHYADDAAVMMAGQAPAKGRDAIGSALKGMLSDPNFTIDFRNDTTEVASSGDLAYTRGTYSVSYTHPQNKQKTSEQGSYVSVFRKGADGRWKVVEDIATPGGEAA